MAQQASHKRLVLILGSVVIAMFGFGFALVPLYNTLCEVLNINGKTDNAAYQGSVPYIDRSRVITIEFVAHTNSNLNWDFYPDVQRIHIYPGDQEYFEFFARNNNVDGMMTVQAIPSVTPGIAAKYLRKTECFCFEQQTLEGKDSMLMPVILHIDSDLPEDITTITLSYTLFDITGRQPRPTDKPTGRII